MAALVQYPIRISWDVMLNRTVNVPLLQHALLLVSNFCPVRYLKPINVNRFMQRRFGSVQWPCVPAYVRLRKKKLSYPFPINSSGACSLAEFNPENNPPCGSLLSPLSEYNGEMYTSQFGCMAYNVTSEELCLGGKWYQKAYSETDCTALQTCYRQILGGSLALKKQFWNINPGVGSNCADLGGQSVTWWNWTPVPINSST